MHVLIFKNIFSISVISTHCVWKTPGIWGKFYPLVHFLLNNETIPWATFYKYLGLHLHSKLSLHKRILETLIIVKRGSVRSLVTWNSRLSVKKLLCKSFLWPIITYGSVIYESAYKTQLTRIQVFLNRELRRYTKAFRFA